jgi:hypothetical protein
MPETIEEALEICLEKINKKSSTIDECLADFPQYEDELREMLPLLVAVKALDQIKPSTQFSWQATNRLVEKLPDVPVTIWDRFRPIFRNNTYLKNRSNKMPQIIVSIILALTLLLGGSFAVEASGPGDFLYKLDRNVEQVKLQLTSNSEKALTLRLQNASERLEEAYKKLQKGDTENALKALQEYNKVLDQIRINEREQVREETRTMTQDEGALQAGTLLKIRESQPEDTQARSAFQKELQRANMGLEQLFGPPEEAPFGPGTEDAQGPSEEAPQGPNEDAPQGPAEDAPQGPTDESPNGPNKGKP